VSISFALAFPVSNLYNVQAAPFNARGDGQTNDAAAILSAIQAAAGTNGTVLFPPGNYYYDTALPIQIPLNVIITTIYPAAITGSLHTTDCFVIGPGQENFPNYPAPAGTTWDSTQEARMSLPSINNFPNGKGLFVNGYNGSHIPYIPNISNCLYGIYFDATNAIPNSNCGLEIYCDTIFHCRTSIVWRSRNTVNDGMQGCYVFNCYVHPASMPSANYVALLHDYPPPYNEGVSLNGLVGASSIDGANVGLEVTPGTPVYAFDLNVRYFGVFNKFVSFGAGASANNCDWFFQTMACPDQVVGQDATNYAYWGWNKNSGYGMKIHTVADGSVTSGLKPVATAPAQRNAFSGAQGAGTWYAGNHLPIDITVPAVMAANSTFTVYAYSPFVFGNAYITFTEESSGAPNSHVTAVVDNSSANDDEIAITVTNFAATSSSAAHILGFLNVGTA
jgi:Pectate lyase superfamily protein